MLMKSATAVAVLCVLAGCSSAPAPLAYDASVALPATGRVTGAYVLGPNDQVRVQVYNEAAITGDYTVDGAGFLAVPVAGRIRAAGSTPEQVERSLRARLNGSILKDARVTVQVLNYAPFYIRGEVKKPGEFPYKPGLTLGGAVALAGGYTYRADEGKAYVRPAGAPSEMTQPLNVDPPITPGDNIRIPERFF